MEKIERWMYGFIFLLGGVFLLIYAGVSLIDLLPKAVIYISKTFFYFLIVFAIIVMMYSVILILIGALIMSVNIRVKKNIALIIFLIGILIVIISITEIIIYSFNTVNTFEIFSGIGVIYLGIRLFFPNDEKKKKEKKILGIVLFILGLIISLSYGIPLIIIMALYEIDLNIIPLALLPFLIGIILLIFGKYSIKITHTTQERKNNAIFSIWMGLLILLISNFSIMSMIIRSYNIANAPYFPTLTHTIYFPLFFFFIGIVVFLHGFFLQQTIRK